MAAIVLERYQYDRNPGHRFQSQSMAKSVTSLLVGVALAEGKIASVDDLARRYVPALEGHPHGETSIRHLLQMSSGVKFSEVYSGIDDVATLARPVRGQSRAGRTLRAGAIPQERAPARRGDEVCLCVGRDRGPRVRPPRGNRASRWPNI